MKFRVVKEGQYYYLEKRVIGIWCRARLGDKIIQAKSIEEAESYIKRYTNQKAEKIKRAVVIKEYKV